MFQETLKELFPSLEAVWRYREVVLFVAGLMKDSRPLVQRIYEMQVKVYLLEMRTRDKNPYINPDLLMALHAESSLRLVDHPLHNKYINYYYHLMDPDTTPVYFPSRLYHFEHMRHEVVSENHLTESTEIPPCTMWISSPDEAVSDALLSICSQISTHQPVSDLQMFGVTCNSLEAPRLIKTVKVHLSLCKFPEVFMEKILRQLKGCRETLKKLWLLCMNLAPFESLLDELLEDLVAHHEAGLAQRELWLRLDRGIVWGQPINLSEEFVKKWRNRCEKVDSIYCRITNY